MNTKALLIVALIALFGVTASSGALLLGYDTVAGSSITPTSVVPNVLGIDLTRGSGIEVATGDSFNSREWTENGGLDAAIAGNDFLQFGISAGSGFALSNVVADFFGDRSTAGPSAIEVFASFDGFATTGTRVLGPTDVGGNGSLQSTMPTAGSNIETITFRLYGYDATSSLGTFDIEPNRATSDFGLTISGDLVAVPEPTSNILLGAICSLGLLHRRRKM